ncbi:gastrula zinc finger protein XlCGF17.1-like isoform X1 [Eurosta solidaginis]|uniref:gastrula zinc finger protein XlCGF17.1-like isoform X1 n=1 Tax=Eurosta solidaginis TaxID=178769 RepID=UPI0035314556
MLNCRKITSQWGLYEATKSVDRGAPQGGVLSPLLWTLVINQLLRRFDERPVQLKAYADDVATVISGKCLPTISSLMDRALRDIHTWASNVGLTTNAEKTNMVLFTKRDKNIRDKNEQYQYPCDICGQHFKRTWDLKIHKGIHSDEKPHKCDFCEKRFVRATALREHLRTHTGEKPYRCKYCERCFTTKRALNQHLRGNHLGDNTHRCEFCPLAFRLASELRLHSTTHKDEIPETHERNMTALREEAKLKVNR